MIDLARHSGSVERTTRLRWTPTAFPSFGFLLAARPNAVATGLRAASTLSAPSRAPRSDEIDDSKKYTVSYADERSARDESVSAKQIYWDLDRRSFHRLRPLAAMLSIGMLETYSTKPRGSVVHATSLAEALAHAEAMPA